MDRLITTDQRMNRVAVAELMGRASEVFALNTPGPGVAWERSTVSSGRNYLHASFSALGVTFCLTYLDETDELLVNAQAQSLSPDQQAELRALGFVRRSDMWGHLAGHNLKAELLNCDTASAQESRVVQALTNVAAAMH